MFNFGNHFYRSKKKLNRKMNYVKQDVLGTQIRHKKDFTWKNKLKNPFRQEEEQFTTRKKVLIVTVILFSIGTFLLWVFHPFFLVSQIQIDGNTRISTEDLRLTLKATLDRKIAFLIPGASYIFVNEEYIKEILMEKYPLKDVAIVKTFPRTIDVQVVEKISYLILDDDSNYTLIDLDGNTIDILRKIGDDEWNITYEQVVEEFTTSTLIAGEEIVVSTPQKREVSRVHIPDATSIHYKYGNYPIIHIPKKFVSNQLISKISKDVVTWYENFPEKIGGGVAYINVEESGNLELVIDKKYTVLTSNTQPIAQQLRIISEVLSRENISYINLRYPDRAYWQ